MFGCIKVRLCRKVHRGGGKKDIKRVKENDELVVGICKGDGNRPLSPEQSHTAISLLVLY